MPAGRPPKYENPEEMQRIIDLYFLAIKSWETPEVLEGIPSDDLEVINAIDDQMPTVSGLAYILGMSRQALHDYEGKQEFLYTIKKAKQRIEIALEQKLYSQAVAGTIFNLKNNFGWKDKTESAVTVNAAGEFLEAIKPTKGLPSERDS